MASDLFDKFRFGQGGTNHRPSTPQPDSSELGASSVPVGSDSGNNASSGSLFDKSQLGQIFIPPSLLSADNGNAPKMDDAMFKRFRDFIYEQCGISFTENKKYLLEGRIAKRLEAHNLTTFDEYYRLISTSAAAREELPSLFEVVTINETYFFS